MIRPARHRVLVADDDPQVIESYRRTLRPLLEGDTADDLDGLASSLFGHPAAATGSAELAEVVYCKQGNEAVDHIARACEAGRPFSLCFLDIRMPPGLDGMEAGRRIRAIDRDINIVIVTGFSDHTRRDLADAVQPRDKLFYLAKPFDAAEIQQMASALANRWSADRRSDQELADRVRELERLNAELQLREATAHRVARQDPLTGLPNRLALLEELERRRASEDQNFSLLYLDLDRFKAVNDAFGHPAGDALIQQLTERLRAAVGVSGFLTRLGGDEFAVVSAVPVVSGADPLCARVLDTCSRSFDLSGRFAQIGVSIGIAHPGQHGVDTVELMRRADIALYAAKGDGRGRACVYDESMETTLVSPYSLAADLRHAIDDDGLHLDYQPQVSAPDNHVYGVEALLRWTHPVLGPISPVDIIAVAEKSELIQRLGEWVIETAFLDAKAWPQFVTSINVSPLQFRDDTLVDSILAMADRHGIEPSRFEFEITESARLDDLGAAAREVWRLKHAGFRIALDDFGTGYSSLDYLRQVSFDRLKIDRSFIQNLTASSETATLVQSIVDLGRSLELSVTAEGVETVEQSAFLSAMGCQQMQGYLFYRPLDKAQIPMLGTVAPWRDSA